MTFASLHAHGSLGTVWKALEFDRRECRLSHEKRQTEKREKKRERSHDPFLLFIYPCGFAKPLRRRQSGCKSKRSAVEVASLSRTVRGLCLSFDVRFTY